MIDWIEGKPGGGKSHLVVKDWIMRAVKAGRHVYTNVDGLEERMLPWSQESGVPVEEIRFTHLKSNDEVRRIMFMDPDDKDGSKGSLRIEVGTERKQGPMIVIDETQMIYDARAWATTGQNVLAFCEYHRHWGLDIVFLTQALKRCDKALVAVGNEFYKVKNLGFLSRLFRSGYYVQVREQWNGPVVSSFTGKYDHRIFRLYKSRRAIEGSTRTIRDFASPFRVACVALVVLGILGFEYRHYSTVGFLGSKSIPMVKGAAPGVIPLSTAGLVAGDLRDSVGQVGPPPPGCKWLTNEGRIRVAGHDELGHLWVMTGGSPKRTYECTTRKPVEMEGDPFSRPLAAGLPAGAVTGGWAVPGAAAGGTAVPPAAPGLPAGGVPAGRTLGLRDNAVPLGLSPNP